MWSNSSYNTNDAPSNNSRHSNFPGRSWPNYDRSSSSNSLAGELRYQPSSRSGQHHRFNDHNTEDRGHDRGNHSYTQLCQSLNSPKEIHRLDSRNPPNYAQAQLKRPSYRDSNGTVPEVHKEQSEEKPTRQPAKKMPVVKKPVWGFRKDTIMLEYFKDHRNLWDTADGNFGNADITKKSLLKLAKELNCKVSNVKTRFRKFRERFLFEVNKLENAERLGSEYTVSWKYFSNLLFLLGNKAFEAGIVKAEIVLDDMEQTIPEIPNQPATPDSNIVASITASNIVAVPTNVNTSPVRSVKIEVENPVNASMMDVESRLILSNSAVTSTPRVSASPAISSSPAISASPAIPPAEETSVAAFCSNNNNDSINNTINNFQITENIQLDSELFGKQVAVHLNNLSPYYREISKLRMQEIMVHFALRSQGFQPPIGLRQSSSSSQPNNSQMN